MKNKMRMEHIPAFQGGYGKAPDENFPDGGFPMKDSTVDIPTIETAPPIELRSGFTPKLYPTKAADLKSSDERVAHAQRIWNKNQPSEEQPAEPTAIKGLKRSKGADCGSWGGAVADDGCHQTSDSPQKK